MVNYRRYSFVYNTAFVDVFGYSCAISAVLCNIIMKDETLIINIINNAISQ